MAYVDQSSVFGYGTKLTSAQMQNLRDNLNAAFNKDDGAPTLADDYITSSMIASGQIGTLHIQPSAVTSTTLAYGTVNSGHLTANCVRADHIGANQVTAGKLALDAVTSGDIANNAVFQANIAAASVSQSKLETDTEELSYDIGANVANAHVFQFSDVAGYFFMPQTGWESGVDSGWGATYGGQGVNGHTSYQTYVTMWQDNSLSQDKYGYLKARYVASSGKIGWLFILKNKNKDRFVASYFSFDHPCWGRSGDPLETPHPFMNDYIESQHEIYCITMTREEKAALEDKYPDLSMLKIINMHCSINNYKKTKWPDYAIPIRLDKNYKYVMQKIEKPSYIKMASLKEK